MNESPVAHTELLAPANGRRRPTLLTRQSLDATYNRTYHAGDQGLQAATKATLEQEIRKAEDAKAYRQKILNEKTGAKITSDKFHASHEAESEAKATFAQCVFNMSNILMV